MAGLPAGARPVTATGDGVLAGAAAAWLPLLTTATLVGTGLVAGVFFAFSTSVLPALAQLPAVQAQQVMQRVNVVILNPLFLGVFVGTAVVAAATVVAALATGDEPWALVAGLVYLAGVFGVTIAANVPLNEALDRASAAEADTAWPAFVGPWRRWNDLRGALAVLALVASALALR